MSLFKTKKMQTNQKRNKNTQKSEGKTKRIQIGRKMQNYVATKASSPKKAQAGPCHLQAAEQWKLQGGAPRTQPQTGLPKMPQADSCYLRFLAGNPNSA